MSAKAIAVQGCTLVCQFGGTARITSSPSLLSSIDGKGIYRGVVEVSVTGSTAGGADGNASGTGSFEITAETVRVDGDPVLRVEDKASFTVYGTHYDGESTHNTEGTETVTIQAAGQNVVNAT